MKTGELIFIGGILFDLFTTALGLLLFPVTEGNPLGITSIILMNALVFYLWFYLRQKYINNKPILDYLWVNIILIVVGSFRFIIGIINIITLVTIA